MEALRNSWRGVDALIYGIPMLLIAIVGICGAVVGAVLLGGFLAIIPMLLPIAGFAFGGVMVVINIRDVFAKKE